MQRINSPSTTISRCPNSGELWCASDYCPPGYPAAHANGQLVDRWDTPLFCRALSRDHIEIRSASPDQTLWTDDDINRQPNGLFGKKP